MTTTISRTWLLVASLMFSACGGGGGSGGNVSPAHHTLTVQKAGNGSGTVSGGGIDCGPTCTASIVEGTAVTLSASPNVTSTFASWSGCDSSSATRCTVTINADRIVTSTFNVAEPAATFSGTVEGRTFSPIEAMSASGTVSFFGNVAVIVLGDAVGLCATVTANKELKNQMYLTIVLAEVDPSTGVVSAPTGLGSYTAIPMVRPPGSTTPPHVALAELSGQDATCTLSIQRAEAISGSVTLTSNAAGAYAGTFDLTLHYIEDYHVTGSFRTTNCPGLIPYLNASQHTCN